MIQENRPAGRCLVRYLGPPPENVQQRRPSGGAPDPGSAAAPIEEVEASSLVKFPGGQSLVAAGWESLETLAAGPKEAKDDQIRREFLLPTNEGRKVY